MSRPGPSNTQSTTVNIDPSDIANSEPFMDALVTFLNEASICMQEVRQRTGLSPGCGSPVRMNDEEKAEKLGCIVSSLAEKCQEELARRNESTYDTDQSSGAAYVTANSTMGSSFAPPFNSTPCSCPPDQSMNGASSRAMPRGGACSCPPDQSMSGAPSSRQMPRGGPRASSTPRPGPSPPRGRVASPDPYFMPVAQSTMNNSSAYSQQGAPCPAYSGSRSTSRGRSDPYSTMVDSGGLPYNFQSGAGGFSGLASQPARNGGGGSCPPECLAVNSAGQQGYRRSKCEDPWGSFGVKRTI